MKNGSLNNEFHVVVYVTIYISFIKRVTNSPPLGG
jgi:hypothetical protein